MKLKRFVITLALASAAAAHSQSVPTAQQAAALSVFGGATGTFTGLKSGKNLGITAGIDLRVHPFFRIDPSIELRGTYPMDKGTVDAQKNFLAGIKLQKTLFFRFKPYVDVLFGRGEIDYLGPGYPSLDGRYYYVQTPSNIFSPGAGIDVDLTHHFAIKADAQLQRYATPVTTSGSVYAKPITVGVIYRFDFNNPKRRRK